AARCAPPRGRGHVTAGRHDAPARGCGPVDALPRARRCRGALAGAGALIHAGLRACLRPCDLRTQPGRPPAETGSMHTRKRWQDGARMKLYWLLGVVLVACTKPNPAACCLDEADCKANGFHEVRMCATG